MMVYINSFMSININDITSRRRNDQVVRKSDKTHGHLSLSQLWLIKHENNLGVFENKIKNLLPDGFLHFILGQLRMTVFLSQMM